MKTKRQTNGRLDKALAAYADPSGKKNPKVVRPIEEDLLGDMLDACWRDELRSWNFLEGAIETAIKDIERHGTEASLDLKKYSVDDAYDMLMEYIWDQHSSADVEAKKKEQVLASLKCWLVDDRHWVLAESRRLAREVLVKETGLVGKTVVGVDVNKKLFDENFEFAETVGQMIKRCGKPMYVGRAD
jgi:hypothetical protein